MKQQDERSKALEALCRDAIEAQIRLYYGLMKDAADRGKTSKDVHLLALEMLMDNAKFAVLHITSGKPK